MLDLEIILITYNREKHLKKTLEQLFEKGSPIHDIDITILDNNSTDGTSILIEKYKKKFPNIKHIINNHNIGGNANIAKAFEIAQKKYVWVLCDDDFYDWSNWDVIKNAIESDRYDLLFTSVYLIYDKKDIAQLVHQATFVPGCIYRTSCLTDEVMQNVHNLVNSMFCQTMISAPIICNDINKVFVPDNPVVLRIASGEESDKTIIRGRDEKLVHRDTKNVFWHIGFIQAIQIISDRKKRNYIVQNVRFNDNFHQSFFNYMIYVIDYNHNNKKGCVKNILDLLCYISGKQRVVLLTAFFTYYIIGFVKDEHCVELRVFRKIKIRVFSSKWFKNIFSIDHSQDNKYRILRLLGLEIKLHKKSTNK